MILSGNVYQGELDPESKEFFYIEEVKNLKSCNIYVNFYSPEGEVYARTPKQPEISKNIIYPNSIFYDYKGRMNYIGKEITIPPKIFDRSKSKSIKVQILITIEATNIIHSVYNHQNKKNKIKYSLYFSLDSKRINKNIPYFFIFNKRISLLFVLF